MAKITVGLGFVRSAAHEEAYRREAKRLPDDWTITMVGSSTTGIFTVTVKGPGFDVSQEFGPDDADDAVTFLEGLKPGRK